MKKLISAIILVWISISTFISIANQNGCYELRNYRAGFLMVEHVTGYVVGIEGETAHGTTFDAVDNQEWYIAYNANEVKIGDCVKTIFIYNPFSNYEDDIIGRWDYSTVPGEDKTR